MVYHFEGDSWNGNKQIDIPDQLANFLMMGFVFNQREVVSHDESLGEEAGSEQKHLFVVIEVEYFKLVFGGLVVGSLPDRADHLEPVRSDVQLGHCDVNHEVVWVYFGEEN